MTPLSGRPLPQLEGGLFLTDGGIETTLIFHDGIELPHFAAFVLLRAARGRAALRRYYTTHAGIARAQRLGFILESPTWRASADWGARLGYSAAELAEANRQSIAMMRDLRDELAAPDTPMVVSGCIGPRGDGYDPGQAMAPRIAEAYHAAQIDVLAQAGADMVAALTMTNAAEAIGIARAAARAGVPAALSFTLGTDGRLPTGQSLGHAIAEVDAATGASPAYYMINCVHPTHFAAMLAAAERSGEPWVKRLRGLRANASKLSHQELNASPNLDAGDPRELAADYAALRRRHPQITILGGCCGTDHRHVAEIGHACRGGKAT
ncbi:MAG TPA: homocysteine S-methyltransferase family protein [Alphaproteobacteria bacterium]|nr:homocysteine S-methyltransferase family protein [Alphaproteobacteria bacterium]